MVVDWYLVLFICCDCVQVYFNYLKGNGPIYQGVGSSWNVWNEAVKMCSIKHKGQSEEVASLIHLSGTGEYKNIHRTKQTDKTYIQIMNIHGICS